MRKFDFLVKYIPLIQTDNICEIITDKEGDGTLEDPFHMPVVIYSKLVNEFIHDVETFGINNKDMKLTRYNEILNDNGITGASDVSHLDAQCVLALITRAIRAERFCSGALLDSFNDGSILKCLKRLESLDNEDI